MSNAHDFFEVFNTTDDGIEALHRLYEQISVIMNNKKNLSVLFIVFWKWHATCCARAALRRFFTGKYASMKRMVFGAWKSFKEEMHIMLLTDNRNGQVLLRSFILKWCVFMRQNSAIQERIQVLLSAGLLQPKGNWTFRPKMNCRIKTYELRSMNRSDLMIIGSSFLRWTNFTKRAFRIKQFKEILSFTNLKHFMMLWRARTRAKTFSSSPAIFDACHRTSRIEFIFLDFFLLSKGWYILQSRMPSQSRLFATIHIWEAWGFFKRRALCWKSSKTFILQMEGMTFAG